MRRAPLAVALLLAAGLAAGAAGAGASRPYGASVVALVVTSQDWDEDRPWEKKAPESRRVNAVVVDGPCLLTTAQMVADASLIQAEKFGRSVRVPARILHVDREVDLALVGIDAPEFFSDLVPVRLAGESLLDGTLHTVRWRNQQLEVSATRVQRMEVQSSHFGRLEHPFLLVQTDLSGGGWAEPVFADHRLVGVTGVKSRWVCVAGGLIMVNSASGIRAAEDYSNSLALFVQQAVGAALGIGLVLVLLKVRRPFYEHPVFVLGLLALTVALLGLCFLMPTVARTNRWIVVPGFRFQPSELAKVNNLQPVGNRETDRAADSTRTCSLLQVMIHYT